MPMTRTMVVLAMAALLTLGVGVPAASATSSTPSTTSNGCATSSLAKTKATWLTSLSKETTTLLSQKAIYTPELLADQLALPFAPAGSHGALVLAGKIVVLQARLAAITDSLTSVSADVSALAVCTSKEFAEVKKHVSWRKLISQRALVTAELSVARSDLAFQKTALAREKKSSDPSKIKAANEKAIEKLIRMDNSQILTDKAELKGLAKKLKAL
jgi:hypothetical protein